MQLNASKVTLAGLLGGYGYRLVIPPYQRPYAWGREQVDDLWDDLMGSLGHGHFMGSLVLNAEDSLRPQVVDGQQRLTTLLLLIRLIQDRHRAFGAENRAEGLYYLLHADPFAEGDEKYRLRTGDANWAVFRDYVLRRHDDPLSKPWSAMATEARSVRARNRALFENARVLGEKLDAWLQGAEPEAAIERLARLQDTLIARLEFVQVSVGNAPDAFLLFETLNDRGLQLSQGDLLKNHLLSRIASNGMDSSAQVEEAADEWDGLLDDLGSSVDVTRFLRHFLLAIAFPVQKEQVFDRFKALVASRGPVTLLGELRTYAKLYGQFADPARIEDDPEMQAQLHALNVLRAEACYPALLMARRFLPRSQFLAFARLNEILIYRYSSVCDLAARELQAAYHKAAKLLFDSKGAQYEAARAEIEAMVPGSAQFIAAFRRLRMGAHYLARYTLQHIERALNPGREFRGNDAVHLEHVMPQTLSQEWTASLGAGGAADHPAFVQRWGNLTLLHGSLNESAGNGGFVDKQAVYAESHVSITSGLCGYLRWGLDAIDLRQQWMATVADSIWSVTGFDPAKVISPPLLIDAALDALDDQERSTLERLLPADGPATSTELAQRVDDHTARLRDHGIEEATIIGESLSNVFARWPEFGTDGRRLAAAAAESVKAGETTSYADWMSASGVGSLIQAVVGSLGGLGRRWRNRAGLVA